jgi:hypothetical protein
MEVRLSMRLPTAIGARTISAAWIGSLHGGPPCAPFSFFRFAWEDAW